MRIRAIEPDEWRALRSLRLRALEDAPDAFGETLDEARAHPDDAWRRWAARGWSEAPQRTLVADDDGALEGLIVGVLEDEGSTAHIYSMWVTPSHRRRGVGRRLLDEIATWAEEQGAERLVLGVTEVNRDARSMYRACSFVEEGGAASSLRERSTLTCVQMSRPLRPEG
jgi:ribosomal protein S18 acetylase RimI-like enzyme